MGLQMRLRNGKDDTKRMLEIRKQSDHFVWMPQGGCLRGPIREKIREITGHLRRRYGNIQHRKRLVCDVELPLRLREENHSAVSAAHG